MVVVGWFAAVVVPLFGFPWWVWWVVVVADLGMILSMVLIPTVNVAVVFGGFFSSGFVGRGGGGFYGFCFRWWWWWWVVEIERQ